MAIEFEIATMTVVLSSERHSVSEVTMLLEPIDNIICASIWACLLNNFGTENDSLLLARDIIIEESKRSKYLARFYPDFQRSLDGSREIAFPFLENSSDQNEDLRDLSLFTPNDSVDLSIQVALNNWLKRIIQRKDIDVYNNLFSHAQINRLEHHSPLLVEIAVGITAGVLTPILLTYGLLRAVTRCRRLEQEARIRELEADEKEEVLKQRRIQTEIFEELRDTIKEKRAQNQTLDIPDGVLEAAANISSPSISNLSSNPIIGSVTLGVSAKT